MTDGWRLKGMRVFKWAGSFAVLNTMDPIIHAWLPVLKPKSEIVSSPDCVYTAVSVLSFDVGENRVNCQTGVKSG